jgi:hypothetical protein
VPKIKPFSPFTARLLLTKELTLRGSTTIPTKAQVAKADTNSTAYTCAYAFHCISELEEQNNHLRMEAELAKLTSAPPPTSTSPLERGPRPNGRRKKASSP